MKESTAQRKVAHVLTVVFLLLGVGLLVWYIWPEQPDENLRRNKMIEIEAAEEKNPAKCDNIKGASYYITDDNRRVSMTEAEARQQCQVNIAKDIVPVLD